MIQTAVRAELIAVIVAVRAVLRCGLRTRIWSDTQKVVARARAFQCGRSLPRINSCDRDLWAELGELVRDAGGLVSFHKVTSHTDEGDGMLVEDWGRHWNHQVDACARQMNQNMPHTFWELHGRAVERFLQQERLGTKVMSLHCTIGQASITRLKARNAGPAPLRSPWTGEISWRPIPGSCTLPVVCESTYGMQLAHKVWQWFKQISKAGPKLVSVSFLQLYLDWQNVYRWMWPCLRYGCQEVGRSQSRWQCPLPRLWQSTYGALVWAHGAGYGQASRFPLQCPYQRAESDVLLHWQTCCLLYYEDWRVKIVDPWLRQKMPIGATRRRGKAAQHLPCASKNNDMVALTNLTRSRLSAFLTRPHRRELWKSGHFFLYINYCFFEIFIWLWILFG